MRAGASALAVFAALFALQPLGLRAAEDPDYVSPLGPITEACRSFNAAGRYAQSLAYCRSAADAYPRELSRGARVFATYRNAAEMLSFAAADELGLGQSGAALRTAYTAHQYLRYVDSKLHITPDQRQDVYHLASVLQRIEQTARR